MTVSISGKQWKIPAEVSIDNNLLEVACGSPILAKLLIRRGMPSAHEAKLFLNPHEYIPTGPMELPDMAKAIVRVAQAIAQNEHITVYGDYDVDGISGASVLVSTLHKLGADVDYYIPNRTGEGYGLNLKAISILASKRRSKLIITCDCGVSNFAEINFAKSLGVDTIVADHHTMPELLPPAVAILHPKLLPEAHPLYHLSGVGVAYKLCEALLLDKGMPEEVEKLLDLVVLGMIADMVPLVADNRYIVHMGLLKLSNTERPGLRALIAQLNSNGNKDIVGFGLAPRINAVGRLADATLAVELMTTDNLEVAEKIARQLQLENTRRQEISERVFKEAEQMISEKPSLKAGKAIAIYKEDWHHGVVGIVASRLVEKYHRPVFIGELNLEEGIVKGSARGVEGIDLYEALKRNEHLLSRFGGHKMAAGFSVEADKADAFCSAIVNTCNELLAQVDLKPTLDIDVLVEPKNVSMDLARLLLKLAPFGMGNKKPLLMMKELICSSVAPLGSAGKHSRITLTSKESGNSFECVMWNSKNRLPEKGLTLDAAFHAEINSFNNVDRLQLVLIDWRHVGDAHLKQMTTSSNNEQFYNASVDVSPKSPVATIDKTEVKTEKAHTTNEHHEKTEVKELASAINISWKDLRNYSAVEPVLEAACRKIKDGLSIFNETLPQTSLDSITRSKIVDRFSLGACKHLMLWQTPPSASAFKAILSKSQASNIYLLCNYSDNLEDSSAFLRRLSGLIRFAVNQKEGKVEAAKLEAVLGTTKMAMALGLTILRKLNLVDWFAEDGLLHFKLLEKTAIFAENLQEFLQLTNTLKEIHQFRKWCTESSIKEIQLSIVPNYINVNSKMEKDKQLDESSIIQFTSTQIR